MWLLKSITSPLFSSPQHENCRPNSATRGVKLSDEMCGTNSLCKRWARLVGNGGEALLLASVGWRDIKRKEAADVLPRLTLRQGQLVSWPKRNRSHNRSSSHDELVSLVDARSTAVVTDAVRKALVPPTCWMAHVENAAILYNGAILAGSTCSDGAWRPRLTVFDLGGGCCRGGSEPLPLKAVLTAGISPTPPRRILKSLLELPREAERSEEHAWILSCMQSHGSTYFHGLAEVAPRLLWGMRLLRANPQMRVLTGAGSARDLLDLLGLQGRALSMTRPALFARKVTVPPYSGVGAGKDMYKAFLCALRIEIQAHEIAGKGSVEDRARAARTSSAAAREASSVLLVRRSAMAKQRARAMLNHDELASVLRHVLDRTGLRGLSTPLVEWPDAATLQQAAAMWSRARLAIAPHGAGGTNLIFMPPGSTFVEIIASDQKGRVYGSLAAMTGLRYVACVYERSDARFRPQLADRIGSDNFVANIGWVLGCLKRGLSSTRNTTDSPLTNAAWRRIDVLTSVGTRPRKFSTTESD